MSEFHDMRGFFISNATHPGQGPQLETAKAGDKLSLQARVYNYSLAQMDPGAKVHVRFYGMEWNNTNNTPIGDSFLIGEDVLAPIPPFNSDPDGAPLNWVLAETTFDTTPYADKYLVFWVVVWSQDDGRQAGLRTARPRPHGHPRRLEDPRRREPDRGAVQQQRRLLQIAFLRFQTVKRRATVGRAERPRMTSASAA